MTARGGATMSWWWLPCLLAGCVQHHDQQTGGTFGRPRSDLFRDPVATPVLKPGSSEPDRAAAQPKLLAAPDVDVTAPDVTGPQPAAQSSAVTTAEPAADEPAAESGLASDSDKATAAPTAKPTTETAPAAARGRGERQLRNAFANADDEGVTQAGLDLAGYLVQRERHFDALFVIDAALKRKRTVPLRLARAGLLRDVARCDLAARELQSVVRQLGARKVSPATLFDLMQAEWVDGQGESAAATLRSIQQFHAGDVWLQDHAADMAEWDRRIREAAPERDPLANGQLRDLFALLRAAPDTGARLKMLDTLAAPPTAPSAGGSETDTRRPVRVRAIAIACADGVAAVRARAVHLAALNGVTDEAFWQVALADPSSLVRRFATAGASKQHGAESAPLLLQAMQREQDERVFQELHETLAEVLNAPAPACTASTAQGRQQAVDHWISQCKE